MKKKDYETFSMAFIQTDTFKTLVVEKHLIDFPIDKSEQKFDYIRSVLKYEDRLTLLIVGLFLLGVLFFTIYEGEFSWWHFLSSLIFISPFLGVI